LTGRQLLRRTEVTLLKAAKKSFFNLSTSSVSVLKAQREIKRDPKRAVELIEKILEERPYDKQANLALKEAAMAAGWMETAAFALQTLLEENSRETKLLHELARVYHYLGDSEREVEVYNRITIIDPSDAQALRLGKDAAARESMKSGGWGAAESYRDLIKDKEAAVSLEQQNRMQLGDEQLDQQIAETYASHQAEPANIDLARRLGSLSEQKDDFASALAWYGYASQLTSESDPAFARKIFDLKIKQTEREITELEGSEDAADESVRTEKQTALEEAKKRRAEMLIDGARKRIERNPTDLQFRFELGEYLMQAGHFREALPELQRARQNPNARLRAMNALGHCYRELRMLDLAARQLEAAASEILGMDATKKEIVYNLGLVYGEMGDAQKSLACMKEIYAVDYGYRDVAERVESSYGSRSGAI